MIQEIVKQVGKKKKKKKKVFKTKKGKKSKKTKKLNDLLSAGDESNYLAQNSPTHLS